MKAKNVTLQNTPLLINNICKHVCLKAPSLEELEKKVKRYEMLLVRCLTNAYQLSDIQLDRKNIYTILPDGYYQTSMLFSFSGKRKEEITNSKKTLEDIKKLAELESKVEECDVLPPIRHIVKNYHKTISLPIEIKDGENELNMISNIQRQFLEDLVEDKDIIKVIFMKEKRIKKAETKTIIISLKIDYDYRDIIEIPLGHTNQDDPGDR